VIQVPPDGQPIVQMRDAQPTGGYPKIGTVIEADLWRLGQAPIGSRIRFVETTWEAALDALDELHAWLAEAARQVHLHRNTGSVA
jgi:allophanate hydrolase subunit 2